MKDSAADENLDLHKAYIQSWISAPENDPNELYAAIKEADKISDYLIQAGELQITKTSERLAKPIEIMAGNALLTLKNCYTNGGLSLTVSGEGALEASKLNPLLQAYRAEISEVRIEEGITAVDNRALWKMSNLKFVALPHSLNRIGSQAFDQCPKLQTVEYRGSIAEWDAIPKGECFLPQQFPNELKKARSPFEVRLENAAFTAEGNSGLTIRAEPTLIQQAVEDFEFEP